MPISIFTVLAILFASTAFAGESNGKITYIDVPTYSPIVLFGLEGKISEKPSCNTRRSFTINLANVGGNAAYRALLLAKSNDFTVVVSGLNTCSGSSTSEDVKSIRIE